MMCLDKGSKDNMSAIVIAFPAAKYGTGKGVAARVEARAAKEAAEQEAEMRDRPAGLPSPQGRR